MTIGYQDEPQPRWWSPWRKWLRVVIAVLPAAAGVALLVTALAASVTALASAPDSTFLSAIVGALIASLGGLLVQYIVFVVQAERDRKREYRKEIALATVLMTELGEALARVSVNLTILRVGDAALYEKLEEARVESWHSLKLSASEFWSPKTIFDISGTYTSIGLSNTEIRRRSARMTEPEFILIYDDSRAMILRTIKQLERRILRAGRE